MKIHENEAIEELARLGALTGVGLHACRARLESWLTIYEYTERTEEGPVIHETEGSEYIHAACKMAFRLTMLRSKISCYCERKSK